MNRIYSLDMLRASAVLLVFFAHFEEITHTGLFWYLGQLGAIGVDIFFALSGYLILHSYVFLK